MSRQERAAIHSKLCLIQGRMARWADNVCSGLYQLPPTLLHWIDAFHEVKNEWYPGDWQLLLNSGRPDQEVYDLDPTLDALIQRVHP